MCFEKCLPFSKLLFLGFGSGNTFPVLFNILSRMLSLNVTQKRKRVNHCWTNGTFHLLQLLTCLWCALARLEMPCFVCDPQITIWTFLAFPQVSLHGLLDPTFAPPALVLALSPCFGSFNFGFVVIIHFFDVIIVIGLMRKMFKKFISDQQSEYKKEL
jgi:hypothetical protein